MPGRHNILNALAAAAAAKALGIPGMAVEQGLATFTGAGRRFEHKGNYNGAEVYDDYAHHPGELHALLTTAKTLGYQRILCAFQPHTYSRTKALFQEFVEELKLPDVAILMEIFAARETDTLGISSKDLADAIPGALYCKTLDEVTAALRSLALGRRSDPDRGRRRHLSGRRKTAGAMTKQKEKILPFRQKRR